jgi:CRP-like cAMP-binding protein
MNMKRPESEAAMRAAFAELSEIPEAEWRHLYSMVCERHFDSRQIVFREGHPAPMIHFIVSGLVRLYYSDNGREVVRGFDYQNRFVTAYESVLTGQPATFSVQALEPTITLSFSGEQLRSLYSRHPCWDRFGRKVLEAQWIRSIDKDRRFKILKPEEHYRLLIERNSPLVNRVPLHQLASFLDITPETLSRIRSRMRDEAASREEA